MGRTKARKTLEAELSVDGINRLIGQLRAYRSSLEMANELFVQRLAESGYDVASSCIVESLPTIDRDKPIGDLQITYDEKGRVTSCTLQFTGEQALFIEFGSGITYNKGKAHPLAKQYGYGVGTYPGQRYAEKENPSGWNYYGNDEKFHHSKGTKATMPIYNAGQEMRQNLIRIAKEVYQGVI